MAAINVCYYFLAGMSFFDALLPRLWVQARIQEDFGCPGMAGILAFDSAYIDVSFKCGK